MIPRRLRALAVGSAAVLVLAVSACSGGGAPPATTDDSGGGGGDSGYTFAMVTHETPGRHVLGQDPGRCRAGSQGHRIDAEVLERPGRRPSRRTLIQNAVDSKVDGIATTLVTPDALAGAVKAATDAGIPVVGFNSGIDQYKELGALDVLRLRREPGRQRPPASGSPPRAAKHPLCVIQAAGSVALEARCAGVKRQGPGHREHPGQRCRRLRGAARRCRPSCRRTRRSTTSSPSARRSPSTRIKAMDAGRQQGEAGHLRPERGRGPGHQGRQDRSSPSTSSPTSRATWPSPRSTSTSRTATTSVAASPVLTGPSFVDKHQHRQDPARSPRTTPARPSRVAGRPAPAAGHPATQNHRSSHESNVEDRRPTGAPAEASNRVQARPVEPAARPPRDRGARRGHRHLHLLPDRGAVVPVARRRSSPCSTRRPRSASSPSASAC